MAGFTKLHASILDSSVWGEPHHIRIVWITMLAMADAEGIVAASVTGLARRAVVSIQEAEEALRVFLSPDKYSRDGTSGERIEVVPGGWLILNHRQYRDKQTHSQAQVAARVRRHRERVKQRQQAVTDGNDVTAGNAFPLSEAEAEAEAEAEKDSAGEAPASAPSRTAKQVRSKPKAKGRPPDSISWSKNDGWAGITAADLAAWRAAYPTCNLDSQLARMDQWLRANPEKATKSRWRRFVTNWLSRSQDRGGDAASRNGRVSDEPPPINHAAIEAAFKIPLD